MRACLNLPLPPFCSPHPSLSLFSLFPSPSSSFKFKIPKICVMLSEIEVYCQAEKRWLPFLLPRFPFAFFFFPPSLTPTPNSPPYTYFSWFYSQRFPTRCFEAIKMNPFYPCFPSLIPSSTKTCLKL